MIPRNLIAQYLTFENLHFTWNFWYAFLLHKTKHIKILQRYEELNFNHKDNEFFARCNTRYFTRDKIFLQPKYNVEKIHISFISVVTHLQNCKLRFTEQKLICMKNEVWKFFPNQIVLTVINDNSPLVDSEIQCDIHRTFDWIRNTAVKSWKKCSTLFEVAPLNEHFVQKWHVQNWDIFETFWELFEAKLLFCVKNVALF